MLKSICLAAVILTTTVAAASAAPGNPTRYNYWRSEACGNGGEPNSQCERAFRRLCGKTPNAACVKRHQKVFDRADKFR